MTSPEQGADEGGAAAARQQFVDLALSVEGLGAAPATLQRYCDLLATSPADFGNPRERSALSVMSSCALVVRGIWFNAGVRHPILLAPYVEQHAVSDVIKIAEDADALTSADPDRGDVVVVLGPSGPHVLTVIELGANGVLVSIDGGQRDAAGLECIGRRSRRLSGSRLDGCEIWKRIDCTKIAAVERW